MLNIKCFAAPSPIALNHYFKRHVVSTVLCLFNLCTNTTFDKEHQENIKPNKSNQIVAQSRGYWIKLAEEQKLRKMKKTEVPSTHAKMKVVENKVIAANVLQKPGLQKDQHGLESLEKVSSSSNYGNKTKPFESESTLAPTNPTRKGK